MLKIYLAGHSDEIEYRKKAKELYENRFELIDPMDNIPTDINKIPKKDFELIDTCDYIIAYINKPSFGTSMEILYAYQNSIPCIVVNPDLNFNYDPWITTHVNYITHDLKIGFEYIEYNYKTSMAASISNVKRKSIKIPKSLKLFGYNIKVEFDDKLKYEKDCLGIAEFDKNKIVLQSNDPKTPVPDIQIEKHFLHELTHWILYVMGEETLTYNERFVDLFARVLQQALLTMDYNK